MKNFSLLFLFVSAAAFAGKEGGGGAAFVCRDKVTNEVLESELVDLYEARANGLTINYDNVTSVDDQVDAAINKVASIHPGFGDAVNIAWKIVQDRKGALSDAIIEIPKDLSKYLDKKDCPLEGMMHFDDRRNSLSANLTVFNGQKTKTDFAASYTHEAVYKALRDAKVIGGIDSDFTRRIVGCLFATRELGECLTLEKTEVPEGKNVWACSMRDADNTPIKFYLFNLKIEPSGTKHWTLRLTRVGDAEFPYRTEGIYTDAGTKSANGRLPIHFVVESMVSMIGLENLGPALLGPPTLLGGNFLDFLVVKESPLTLQNYVTKERYPCQRVR